MSPLSEWSIPSSPLQNRQLSSMQEELKSTIMMLDNKIDDLIEQNEQLRIDYDAALKAYRATCKKFLYMRHVVSFVYNMIRSIPAMKLQYWDMILDAVNSETDPSDSLEDFNIRFNHESLHDDNSTIIEKRPMFLGSSTNLGVLYVDAMKLNPYDLKLSNIGVELSRYSQHLKNGATRNAVITSVHDEGGYISACNNLRDIFLYCSSITNISGKLYRDGKQSLTTSLELLKNEQERIKIRIEQARNFDSQNSQLPTQTLSNILDESERIEPSASENEENFLYSDENIISDNVTPIFSSDGRATIYRDSSPFSPFL
jgi:hypothetical protein